MHMSPISLIALLYLGLPNADAVIRGHAELACAPDLEAVQGGIVTKVEADPAFCKDGGMPKQTGGWSCYESKRKPKGCDSKGWRCNTQFICGGDGGGASFTPPPAEEPKTEAPKVEEPKAEPPKAEPVKAEPAKVEEPKAAPSPAAAPAKAPEPPASPAPAASPAGP
jgi:hypothetical protein